MTRSSPTPPRQHAILLIGPTGSGKTSFVKSLTKEHVEIVHGVRPSTSECQAYMVEQEFADGFTHFAIIDTPGFDASPELDSDLNTVEKIARYLDKRDSELKICGAIYFHRITDKKFMGVAQTSLAISKSICGEGFFPRVAAMTTMWDTIDSAKYNDFEILNEELDELDNGHLRLSETGPPIFKRLHDDEESSREVLKHFAQLAKTEEAPELALAMEWRKMRRNGRKQAVQKTAAGKKIMEKVSADRPCTIF
ncbi:hypothetical protein B0H67DRAFT_647168 [Lasiosphaeris hirsuta]|uniref:G domain-containing protein n=1 Tax=Lasiosphaeris hirsuta TaxID=260670 RepID=A0AA40A9P9_9PEZI|nr:hypothetical protein B0H67DRAFT_647168 [Lasiosphaeris hirsuta]